MGDHPKTKELANLDIEELQFEDMETYNLYMSFLQTMDELSELLAI